MARNVRRRSTICHMAATDDRETESGIPVKPVYTAADAPAERELPGEYPVTRGTCPDAARAGTDTRPAARAGQGRPRPCCTAFPRRPRRVPDRWSPPPAGP